MKNETYVYPAVFYCTPSEAVPYFVDVPDFGAPTQGADYPDALEMTEDLICCLIEDLEERGEPLPAPSPLSEVHADESIGAERFIAPVVADYGAWKQRKNNRSVRKNCSLPEWLALEAEKAGISFSAVLQKGLREALGLSAE